MNLTGFILAAFGVLLLAGAFFDWEWFMNNYKSRRLVRLIGRKGARIVYSIAGLVIVVFGVLFSFNIIGAA